MLPESYQDLYEPQQPEGASFATIDQIFADGVTLRFDGMDAPTAKRYKCNAFVVFQPGDRVRVIKDSRTYVVEYPVGNPRTAFAADSAAQAERAKYADTVGVANTVSLVGAGSAGLTFYSGGGDKVYYKAGTSGKLMEIATR